MNTIRQALIWCFFLLSTSVFAQVDTEFWFVVPEVDINHGDRPISLRVATLDEPASITVSMPANPSFTPQTLTIGANSLDSLELTSFIGILENRPANQILNKGLYITSTAPITAYYEVKTSCNCNPDIFPLKGANALGTDFWIIAQNLLSNALGTSSFDIVATEDGTVVEITPKKSIVGHAANQTFTISLDRGETYSATATGLSGSSHLMGSRVVSNKPIAITLKDDSIQLGTCWDLMGEQMVPSSLAGQEYIVMKGYLDNNGQPRNDYLFVLATENGTTITIEGSNVATINAGETYRHEISSNYTYLETSAPTHVLHMTGFGCEVGGSILPSISCTGSQKVSFTRSTNEFFAINVMTRAENISGFTLLGGVITAGDFSTVPNTNGEWVAARVALPNSPVGQGLRLNNSSGKFHLGVINGDSFTGCRYGYFSSYSRLLVDVTVNNSLAGSSKELCLGDDLLMEGEEIEGAVYSWTGPNGFTSSERTFILPNIGLDQAGVYSLQVTSDNCESELNQTTINVLDIATPTLSLSSSATNICRGDAVTFEAAGSNLPAGDLNYIWLKNGSAFAENMTALDLNNLQDGDQISVQLTLPDGNGSQCLPSNVLTTEAIEITVSEKITAQVEITPSQSIICEGEEVVFTSQVSNAGEPIYQWLLNGTPINGEVGSTYASSALTSTDVIALRITDTSPCAPVLEVTSSNSSVSVLPAPAVSPLSDNGPVCQGESIQLNVNSPQEGITYQWVTPSGQTLIGSALNLNNSTSEQSGTYTAVATNGACTTPLGSLVVEVNNPAIPEVVIEASKQEVCIGEAVDFTANIENIPSDGVTYQWFVNTVEVGSNSQTFSTGSLRSQDQVGLKILFSGEGESRCYPFAELVAAPITISVLDPPPATVTVTPSASVACLGDLISFKAAVTNAGSNPMFTWRVNGNTVGENLVEFSSSALQDGDAVTLTVGVSETCSPTPSITSEEAVIEVQTHPSISLEDFYEFCPEEEEGITLNATTATATNYEWLPNGETTAKILIDEPGSYTVRASTSAGCSSERELEVLATCPMDIFVPTAFSPNGDGKNDVFKLFGRNIKRMDFRVYNRWGETIFRASSLEDIWDGTFNGKPVPPGNYYWHIECVPIDSKQPRRGDSGELMIFAN